MMALNINSPLAFNSAVKLRPVSSSSRSSSQPTLCAIPSIEMKCFVEATPQLSLGSRGSIKDVRWGRRLRAADSNKTIADSGVTESKDTTAVIPSDQLPSTNVQSEASENIPTSKQEAATPKRSPLTARERLRAARVLSRYTESNPKPAKPEMGRSVLDAIRESDKGKKKPGLPEAPGNLFDDSKRGMPKAGLTFDLPVGGDLLVIIASFVTITTIMFTTTYVVWKLGAIHFNEY